MILVLLKASVLANSITSVIHVGHVTVVINYVIYVGHVISRDRCYKFCYPCWVRDLK